MELDQLVRDVLAGNRRARNELGQRLLVELDRFFAKSFADADADDLAQTTLIIVFRKLPEFEFERSFLSWVRAIARLEAREAYRQRYRRQRLVESLVFAVRTPPTNLSSRLDRAGRREIVKEELAALDSRYRRVIENDLDEGDPDEFIRRERIKRGSLRTRRHRAYAKLRRRVRARVRRGQASTPTPPRTPPKT